MSCILTDTLVFFLHIECVKYTHCVRGSIQIWLIRWVLSSLSLVQFLSCMGSLSLSLLLSIFYFHLEFYFNICYTHDSTQFVCVSLTPSRVFRAWLKTIFPLILATDDILCMDVCRFACLPACLIGCLPWLRVHLYHPLRQLNSIIESN